MSALPFAVIAGVALGVGLWILAARVPRVGARRLEERVAASVVDVSPAAREIVDRAPADPASLLALVAAPLAHRVGRLLDRLLGGDATLERLLQQAGWTLDPRQMRARRLVGAAVGAAVGVASAVAVLQSLAPPAIALVVAVTGLLVGAILPDRSLTRAAARRRARVAAELPTVLEFLTLSLAAGESILDALRRVARAGSGDLAREFARVVAQVHTGEPLADALRRCADDLRVPALTRTVDQLTAALERGAPLAEVLRAQASDSRVESKRLLLESAGRKEIAMLLPLVFGILPVTVAFAIFPGVMVLQLGF